LCFYLFSENYSSQVSRFSMLDFVQGFEVG
jgi:hypothetical protein